MALSFLWFLSRLLSPLKALPFLTDHSGAASRRELWYVAGGRAAGSVPCGGRGSHPGGAGSARAEKGRGADSAGPRGVPRRRRSAGTAAAPATTYFLRSPAGGRRRRSSERWQDVPGASRWPWLSHSSVLVWRIPGMGEPGGVYGVAQSRTRLQSVVHQICSSYIAGEFFTTEHQESPAEYLRGHQIPGLYTTYVYLAHSVTMHYIFRQ